MVNWGTHTERYDTCRTRLLETIAELEENKVLTGALRVTLVKIDSGDLDPSRTGVGFRLHKLAREELHPWHLECMATVDRQMFPLVQLAMTTAYGAVAHYIQKESQTTARRYDADVLTDAELEIIGSGAYACRRRGLTDGRVINMTEVSLAVHASHTQLTRVKDLSAEAHACAKADVLAGCEKYSKDADYQVLALSIVDRAFARSDGTSSSEWGAIVEDHPWLGDHLAQIEAECLSAEKQDALLAKKKCSMSAVVQLAFKKGPGNRTRQPIMTNINKDGRSKRESMLSEMLMLDKQIGTKCFQRGASLEYSTS